MAAHSPPAQSDCRHMTRRMVACPPAGRRWAARPRCGDSLPCGYAAEIGSDGAAYADGLLSGKGICEELALDAGERVG